MRKLMIAVAALFVVSPAVANNPVPVERVVYYYEDDSYRNQVGEAVFFCDSTIVTYGMVTSSTQEVVYTCP